MKRAASDTEANITLKHLYAEISSELQTAGNFTSELLGLLWQTILFDIGKEFETEKGTNFLERDEQKMLAMLLATRRRPKRL